MTGQASLFDEEPRYCIDTNVIVSFLRQTEDEYYGSDVFAPQWQYIEQLIDAGAIIAPRQVERELLKWAKTMLYRVRRQAEVASGLVGHLLTVGGGSHGDRGSHRR